MSIDTKVTIFIFLAVFCLVEIAFLQKSVNLHRVAKFIQVPSKKPSRVRNSLILQNDKKQVEKDSSNSETIRYNKSEFEESGFRAFINTSQSQNNAGTVSSPNSVRISEVRGKQSSFGSSAKAHNIHRNLELKTKSVSIDKRPRLPKALIIGFSKCGTAALRTFLTIHPNVVSPISEVRYFTMYYSKGPEWYRNQMPPSTQDQITIEKTPMYIMTNESLRRIHDFDSGIKLLVIVRDPIVRLQSQYAHEFCHTDPAMKPSFKDYWGEKPHDISVIRWTHYARYIRQVYNLFPRQQVLVVSEDELERDPLPVLKETEKFLGLRPGFTDDMFVFNKKKDFYCFNVHSRLFPNVVKLVQVNSLTGCLGEEKGRNHPQIGRDYLEHLKHVIRPLNEELFTLIGRQFQWDNFDKKS